MDWGKGLLFLGGYVSAATVAEELERERAAAAEKVVRACPVSAEDPGGEGT